MNPLTLEWVEKAEGDLVTARRELRPRLSPNYDAVCIHSQQVAEKYLKAVLQENIQNIPNTHQLMDLLALWMKVDNSYHFMHADLIVLEGYAVRFRYPGQSADKFDAKSAFKSAQIARAFVREKLGLG